MLYTIKQVSKMTKISEHTIRFWAKKGLFTHLQRDKNGVRYFDKQDLQLVSLVHCFRELELGLDEIKHYLNLCLLGDETLEQRCEFIKKQRDKVKSILQDYSKILKRLDNKVKIYEKDIERKRDSFNPYNKNYLGKDFYRGENQNYKGKNFNKKT